MSFRLIGTSVKSQNQIESLTKELVDTVEERNALVQMLEEDRIRWEYFQSREL